MCTLAILRRPTHPWPVLIAANRDEMEHRPWRPPARHWPDRPEVVAGLDEEAGGSWLGLNDHGLVAGVLNRRHSLGPAPGVRSRGELVLEALDHADAVEAADALGALNAHAYRAFNLVVADNRDAYWVRSQGPDGPEHTEVFEIPEGLSMITAYDLNDTASPRIGANLARLDAAPVPNPDAGDWAGWIDVLASRQPAPVAEETRAMNIVTDFGFGTVSSALIALPDAGRPEIRPVWLFAAGRPDEARFEPVAL